MVARNLNIYLDTLYSAFEMIASGITTVQHIHGWMPGGCAEVEARAAEVIRAYEDIGMRVSYCFALRDQNRLVYEADEDFVASLPRRAARPDAALVRPLPAHRSTTTSPCSSTCTARTTPSAG